MDSLSAWFQVGDWLSRFNTAIAIGWISLGSWNSLSDPHHERVFVLMNAPSPRREGRALTLAQRPALVPFCRAGLAGSPASREEGWWRLGAAGRDGG